MHTCIFIIYINIYTYTHKYLHPYMRIYIYLFISSIIYYIIQFYIVNSCSCSHVEGITVHSAHTCMLAILYDVG